MKVFITIFQLSIMTISLSSQTPLSFSHTDSTQAPPERIWEIWTNVSNWPTWDAGLRSARLKKGPFREGAKGKLKPDKGPKASFWITEVEEGIAYTLKTRIPFGWLIVRRRLWQDGGWTYFRHEVEFTGWLKKTFARKFGPRYREMLPSVLQKIKMLAEIED